ncbi:ABC transporter permease [Streptomonospora litoralis]|uniref:Transport permease protein n=1 Tax=Streptomonospora litoralis TaxID=2498135 RepID=A0A4P6Q476_9ACTN|nr:ABC transporter permease [Streptomonospora litoralis]QBI55496.1 Daunorubicin/doxorubicin resistance ABC transporter permease protein DrrB [Streptomonospora litoralis]
MSATNAVTDTATVFTRELRPVLRDPVSIVFSMVQPLFFLALFAPLLPESVAGTSSLQWFVPGVLVMSCLFATGMTGSNLLYELQTGSHERLLVSPLRRSALLTGRALKEVVPVLAQAAIITAATVPFGFRPSIPGALAGLLVLGVLSVGLGSLSYALALASKDREWLFWSVQQTLLFPLLLSGGALLPVEEGPGWLRTLAAFNPLTYVVDAERALAAGHVVSADAAEGLLAAALVAAAGLYVGIRAMRRG